LILYQAERDKFKRQQQQQQEYNSLFSFKKNRQNCRQINAFLFEKYRKNSFSFKEKKQK